MPRSPKSPTPPSRPPPIAITARLVVRRVKDARYRDALFPVWRYHPFFTNTDLPGRAGRHHPPPPRHHRNRVRRSDRRTAGTPALGSLRRQLRLDPVRGDRPQPAARRRRPGRRPAHPRTRIDAAPQDRHRPGPAGPPATPTDPAPTHPLALVQTLAYVVAQHHRIQPATIRASLTIRRKARPKHQQEKLGRPADTPCPQPDNQDHLTQRHSARPVGGSRLSPIPFS